MYTVEIHDVGGTRVEIIRKGNLCIPKDNSNQDYSEYLAWVAKGNKAEVVDLTPVLSLDERRQAEYEKRGCTLDALSVALWEKVVEGRPEEADRLQSIRDQVKLDIPKDVVRSSRSRKRK